VDGFVILLSVSEWVKRISISEKLRQLLAGVSNDPSSPITGPVSALDSGEKKEIMRVTPFGYLPMKIRWR
jgi:hypothetical protein